MSPQRPSSHRRHRKARTAASTSPRLPVRTARRAESAGCVQTTQTAHRQGARTYTPNGKHALSVSSMSVDVECCRWQALATSGHCRSGQWLVRTHGSRYCSRCGYVSFCGSTQHRHSSAGPCAGLHTGFTMYSRTTLVHLLRSLL